MPPSATVISSSPLPRARTRTRAVIHLGVLDDIEQKLPDGLEEEHADLFRLGFHVPGRLDGHHQAMLLVHLMAQPFQSVRKTLLIEDGGAQLGRHRARDFEGLREGLGQLAEGLPEGPALERILQDLDMERRSHKQLLEVVVEDLGQTPALPLLGLGQLERHGPELLGAQLGRPEGPVQFLRPLAHLPFEDFLGLPVLGHVPQGQQA